MSWLIKKMINNKSGRVSLLKLGAIGSLAVIFLCLGLRAGFRPGKGAIKEAQASPSGSWLAGYSYQKAIVIDNTANASALSDYQVKVTNPIYDETGLVGSWHFEENTGTTTADTSGYTNTGTLSATGATWTTSGKFGNALSFDGSTGYVQNTSPTNLPTGSASRTMEAWIKPAALPGGVGYGIISYGAGSGTSIASLMLNNNKLYFANCLVGITGTTALSAGNWYHVAAVYDGTNITLYVNGAFDSSGAITLSTTLDADGIRIGRASSCGGTYFYFNGSMDEARVYNRALSAAEIKAQYEAKAKLNYGDVRFTDADGITELVTAGQGNYWMEKDGTFWVKVPYILASSTKTIYMYYGKSDASQIYNGANTFIGFDNFVRSNGAIGGGWTVGQGAVTISSNSARFDNTPDDPWIYRSGLNNNIIATIVFSISSANTQRVGGFSVRAPASGVWLGQGRGQGYGWSYGTVGGATPNTLNIVDNGVVGSTTPLTLPADTSLTGEMIVKSNDNLEVRVWQTGTTKPATPTQTYTTAPASTGSNYAWGYNSQGSLLAGYGYLFYVRKYASPEPTTAVYAEQENVKFNFYKTITLTPATPLANYQVKVTVGYNSGTGADGVVNLQSGCKTDFSDIRFGDALGNNYSYWRKSYTSAGTATFWVKVPTSGTSTIYIYYGNASATSASNGANTFEFFDDFEQGNTAKWTAGSGATLSIQTDSTKYLHGNRPTGVGSSYMTMGYATGLSLTSYVYEGRARFQEWYVGITFRHSSDNTFNVLLQANNPDIIALGRMNAGVRTDVGATQSGFGASTNVWYPFKLVIDNSGNIAFTYNGVTKTWTDNVLPAGSVGFSAYQQPGQGENNNIDDIRVRKYVATEPAVTAAGAQTVWNAKANTYSYRKPVTIDNTGIGNAAQYNYQVPVTVDTAALISAGKMNADGSDIRFSATNDFKEENWLASYPYWIESGANTATTKIWVKVDSLAAAATKTIYMYYGNAGAASVSNGTNTFQFFDDFSGDLSKWNINAGTPTVSGGEVTIQDLSSIVAKTIIPYPVLQKIRVKPISDVTGVGMVQNSALATGLSQDDANNDIFYTVSHPDVNYRFVQSRKATVTSSYFPSPNPPNNYNEYKTVEQIWTDSSYILYQNSILYYTKTDNIPIVNLYPHMGTYRASPQSKMIVDYIYVRKYAANDPAGVPGIEQSRPPTVTSAAISVSGATGTGGVFKSGDTMKVVWDNSATGDNNSGITGVTGDFSSFGGSSAAAMNDSGTGGDTLSGDNKWTGQYALGAGLNTTGNVSVTATNSGGSTTTADDALLTVDTAPPTASKPTAAAQSLKSGDVSSSTVQSTEAGNIYLVKTGTAASTQAQINTAVTANTAFLGKSSAAAATPYTVTLAASLVDGVYDIVAVDTVGNVSAAVAGWLTVDNTPPNAPTAVTFTATGGTVLAANTLNATNTNFTATATITAGDATGGTAELLKGGASFSTPITVTNIAAGATSVSFNPGLTTNAQVQAAFASSAALSVKLTDAAGNSTTSSVANPTITVDYIAPNAPTAVTFTATGGTVLAANTLNATNTNFTATATITAGDATGGTAELLKGGASFSTPITVTNIAAGATSVSFNPGLTTNAQVQAAFASSAALSVKLTDAAGNSTTSSVANPTITADYIAPTVSSAALNYSTGVLTITCSENADTNTANVLLSKLHINNVTGTNLVTLSLPSAATVSSIAANVITIQLTEDQRYLAWTKSAVNDGSAVVLDVDAGAIRDAAGNVIAQQAAIAVTETPDTQKPVVSPPASLNYKDDVKALTVNFSKTISASSTLKNYFHLRGAAGVTAGQVTLDAGQAMSYTSTSLTFTLTEAQRVAALAISGVPGGDSSAVVLDIDAAGVTDMAGNTILSSTGNTVTETADITAPVLNSWSLDVNSAALTLNFSETMKASTFNPSGITLQDAATSTAAYTLTNSATASANGATIVVDLSSTDANEIKKNVSLATSINNSYLILSGVTPVLKDMALNNITAIANGSALKAAGYTPDTTKPTISSAALNYNTGVLTVTCSEAVNVSATVAGGLYLSNSAGSHEITLSASELTTSANGTTLSFTLSKAHKQTAIAISSHLAPAGDGAAVVLDADVNAIADMAGNKNLAASIAVGETLDTTKPVITASAVSVNAAGDTVTITSDEPLKNASSEAVTGGNWTIKVDPDTNPNNANETTLVLTNASLTYTPASAQVGITLNEEKDGAYIPNGYYVYVIPHSSNIKDLAGNAGVSPAYSAAVPKEGVAPQVASWSLNMGTGVALINFSEVMDTSQAVDQTKITLQKNNNTNLSSETQTLTNSAASWYEADPANPTRKTLKILLSVADLVAIQSKSGLCVGQTSSYLEIASGSSLKDIVGNLLNLANVTDGACLQAASFYADATPPTLTDFKFYLTTPQTITLTFNEPVSAASLNTGIAAGAVTLQNTAAANPTNSRVLQDSTTASSNGVTMVINLGPNDLSAIVLDSELNLGVGSPARYIKLTSAAITDSAGNGVNPVTLAASEQRRDIDNPVINSAALNYGTGVLTVNLSEIIKANDTLRDYFHLRSAAGVTVGEVTLAVNQAMSTQNAATLTFTLTEAQRDNALAISGKPGGDGSAVVLDVVAPDGVTGGAITDMAGNKSIATNGVSVSETADTLAPNAPTAISFSASGAPVTPNYINGANTGFTVTFTSPATEYIGTAHLYSSGADLATPVTAAISAASTQYILTGNSAAITQLGADGVKSLRVVIVDRAGNVGVTSAAVSLTKDTVTPTFTIGYYTNAACTTALSSNYLKAGTYYIKISASEALSAAPTISINAEGTANDVPSAATTLLSGNDYVYTRAISADLAAVGSVAEAITISGSDPAGNTATNSAVSGGKYTDTTAPTATAAPTAAAGPYINAAEESAGFTVVVSLGTSGAVAGDSLELLLNSVSFPTPLTRTLTSADITAGTYTFTVASGQLGADGAKVITARVTDIAGNIGSTSPSLSLTKDTVTPTFTIGYYTNAACTTALSSNYLKAGTYYIKISASEALSAAPTISINAEGTANDVPSAATTLLSGNDYVYTRAISADLAAVGSVAEAITISGSDPAGNTATNSAVSGGKYTDTTAPALSSWTLNLATKKATLTFSETADVSVLDVTKITLQNAATASTSYTLTNSTTASSNGTSIVIDLSAADSAALYANTSLAISQATSYIRLTAAAIKDLAGNNITAIADGAAVNAASFTSKAAFTITAPASGASWAVNEATRAITWTATGNLGNATLWYATAADNYAAWTQIDSSSSILASSGTRTWSVIPDLLSSPQSSPSISVKVKVRDATDTSVSAISDPFNIIYYGITWRVMDSESLANLTALGVTCSSGWTATGLSSSAGITRYYKYGTYTTTFSKDQYQDGGKTDWVADSTKTSIVYLESTLAAQIPWNSVSKLTYDSTTDKVKVTSWIEKRSILRTDPTSVSIAIYDTSNNLITTLNSSSPSSDGIFQQSWDVSGISSPGIYLVKTSLVYHSVTYAGASTYNLSLEKTQASFQTATASQLATVQTAVGTTLPSLVSTEAASTRTKVASESSDIKTKVTSESSTVQTKVTDVKTETNKILTATGTDSLATKISDVKTQVVEQVQPHVKSAILNRENVIKQGAKITIRYRTDSGLVPKLSVYSPKDVLLVSSATMTEIGATGIYEYSVTFLTSWGKGDFTVVCSESTKGTVDALVITVKETDIDAVSSSVASVLGATSGITDLRSVTSNLSTQFSGMDRMLAQISKDTANKVNEAKGAVNDLSVAVKQLEEMSKQIKNIGGTKGINLEKLYEVSKDKKEDITYIKNKSEELKAAMELNQKMLENATKKPVVQTWFEFK